AVGEDEGVVQECQRLRGGRRLRAHGAELRGVGAVEAVYERVGQGAEDESVDTAAGARPPGPRARPGLHAPRATQGRAQRRRARRGAGGWRTVGPGWRADGAWGRDGFIRHRKRLSASRRALAASWAEDWR